MPNDISYENIFKPVDEGVFDVESRDDSLSYEGIFANQEKVIPDNSIAAESFAKKRLARKGLFIDDSV